MPRYLYTIEVIAPPYPKNARNENFGADTWAKNWLYERFQLLQIRNKGEAMRLQCKESRDDFENGMLQYLILLCHIPFSRPNAI